MKVGKYQIGRYHAIIKKTYENGSVDYETSFTDQADLMESVSAIRHCIGKLVGTATDNPQVLVDMAVIRGKENIEKELGGIHL
jgi:antitoxin component YwqK of YwqJK toxin-antitoxin module